jgi:homoserine O-succinyltransferase
MALVRTSGLPAFDSMAAEGAEVVDGGSPELRIGLLNLMPDAALRATDRQFIRLVSAGSAEHDISVYPFTVAADARGPEARAHIDRYYTPFADVRDIGLDALIVTGANPAQDDLEREAFWSGLGEVLDWGQAETRSILCSCLATHAVVQKYRNTRRVRLPEKMWGLYQHRMVADHPLLEGLDEPVEAPHSHWYDLSRETMEDLGLVVLMESDEAGVHMAVDDSDFYVFFQGHPEYDLVSLLKEYRRELGRFYRGERDDYPPIPEHYFDTDALVELEEYRPILEKARDEEVDPPRLDEERLIPRGPHPWNQQGKVIYRNWLRRLAEQC